MGAGLWRARPPQRAVSGAPRRPGTAPDALAGRLAPGGGDRVWGPHRPVRPQVSARPHLLGAAGSARRQGRCLQPECLPQLSTRPPALRLLQSHHLLMCIKRPLKEGGAGCARRGGRRWPRRPGRGPFLKNTKRSSPGGHFGRFGYVKLPRARGERALGGVAAPCPTDRAGGGRAWVRGREKRSRRPRDAVVRVPCFPTGTSSRRAGP